MQIQRPETVRVYQVYDKRKGLLYKLTQDGVVLGEPEACEECPWVEIDYDGGKGPWDAETQD